MKWYSPIFLCTIFLFLSCGKSEDKDVSVISAQLTIAKDYNLSADERLIATRKAFVLSDDIKNDSLRFQAVVTEFDIIHENYPDSIQKYLSKLKSWAIKPKQKSSLFLREGDVFKKNQQYNKAYDSYKESKIESDKTKDSLRIAYVLLNMAEIANIFNDYAGSQETATEALAFLTSSDRNDYKMQAYNLLGITYSCLQQYPNARESYQNALKMNEDELGKDIISNNIAYVYILERQYVKAATILQNLLKRPTILSNPDEHARVLHNLGFAENGANPNKGVDKMQHALKIREANGNYQDLPFSYLDLSDYYKTENPAIAKAYSEKALQTATNVNSIDQRIDALMQLVKLTNGTESKKAFLQYERLNDSITSLRRIAKNEFAMHKYNFRKSDQENAKLKMQSLYNERKELLYGIAIGLLFISGMFVVYIIRRRNATARKLEAYKTETRISRKIHDELANDVFDVIAFAEVQNLSENNNKEVLLNNLDNIYSRTRDFSRANSTIDTNSGFAAQLKDMMQGYSGKVTLLTIGFDVIEWQKIAPPIKIALYRIIQELLANMKKHSHADRVVLNFSQDKKNISVHYSDDGEGTLLSKEILKNGMLIMENRIRDIKGNYTFENQTGKGFRMHFVLPLK